jgi:hypothetical protein
MPRYGLVLTLMFPTLAPAQQAGSAGATRPKLEVLQSLPEAQLFPLMNLIATSLGVRCDHCHVQSNPDLSRTPANVGGWVWDSDEKLPKRRAREMMKMVVELNSSRFKGESKVTCYTCHRGATQPSRLPTLPPASDNWRAPARITFPSADRVWDAYRAAVGRVDAGAGTGIVMRGWDERSEGRYGRVEITVAESDRYRLTLTSPEGTTNQGIDEDGPWGAINDRLLRFTSPADVARIRRIAMRYQPVKEQAPGMRTVALERLPDFDAFVLEGRFDSLTTRRAYFDVVTGLLRREITTIETLLLPLEEHVDYDDYRDVNGVKMPFRIRISDGAPYSTTTRTIMEIQRNVSINDSVFRPPSSR